MKVAIITGGTKGIGAAIAKAFVADGYAVTIAARNNTNEAKGLVKELGPNAQFVQVDVTSRISQKQLVDAVVQKYGRLDCFVNCAGVSIWRALPEVDEAFWNQIVDTNAKGTFWGCQAAAAVMKKGATIVNVSSLAGKRGSANNSVYCASKFAVNGITQALAKELGPKGIRVNAVCPVYVETDMILNVLKDSSSPASGQDVGTYLKNFTQGNTALLRLPLAEEVASTCLYFASEAASAITGQCLNVDCGVLPQ